MKAEILRDAVGAPFPTAERCEIRELLNDPASPGASLAETRVAPGVTTQLHSLDVDERYLVISGRGRMELHGSWTEVGPGDAVLIPAGAPQRIENHGDAELAFFCLCTPRFRPDGYRNLEDPA